MRDIRKTFSASIEHLHDLMFDRDEVDSLPLGADYTGVIYSEGYLFKQSRSMRKFWKMRYFVLRNDGLLYFRTKLDKDGAPLGVIPLTRLSMHLDNTDTKSAKPKYCLRLTSRHFYFKTFCLCSFSQEERNNWLTSLLTAISEDLVSSFTLTKFREKRSLSVSSTDSGVSEGNSTPTTSPNATLNGACAMTRTESCDIGSLLHDTDIHTEAMLNERRPSRSLGSLSELRQLDCPDGAQTSPKKTKKSSFDRLRKLKAFSAFEFKNMRGSYIDLSCLGNA